MTATVSAFGSMSRSELLPAYVKLLRDTEAEVRVAAAGKVSAISKMLTSDRVIASIVPCVKDLAADSSQHVRSALASVVMEVAPVLGKSATIEHLLPVFLSLLKDDFPDVRLNIISKLDQVNQVCRLVPHDLNSCPAYHIAALRQSHGLHFASLNATLDLPWACKSALVMSSCISHV